MSGLDILSGFNPIADRMTTVEEELERLLQSDVPVVEKLLAHVRSGKGKRLRPALLLLTARFLGYEGEDAVRMGAVFELIHTATLVHDDVIDHAQLRRGRPTLNRIWGNTLTVLFGDLLSLLATESALRCNNRRVMDILCEVSKGMVEGELIQNDILFKMDTTRKDYFNIQVRKTALLFGGCAETAGVLAGRNPLECAALQHFGLEIGRSFQLMDDLLDFTGTLEELGKPAFSDLREGKLTLPMLTLLDLSPDETRPLIRAIWDRGEEVPIPEDEEMRLRQLLDRHDALAETRTLAHKASQAAAEAIDSVDGDKKIRSMLQELPGRLLSRKF